MKPPVKFHWRGNHHSYYGIFFVAFGLFNFYMSMNNLEVLFPVWGLVTLIGIGMVIDDIIEHTLTGSTPLRLLWIKCILPLINRKNK